MVDVEAPVVEPCRHSFFLEDAVHFAGAPQQVFFPAALTHAEHYGALAIHLHPRVVARHILQEILRRVFVYGAIHISVEAVAGVIESAQGNHAVEQVGPAEEEVGSMKAAHRAAAGEKHLFVVHAYVWQQFVNHIAEPTLVLLNAPALVATFVRPRFPVDAVDANHTQAACLDKRCKHIKHVIVLPIVEPAVLTWECNHCLPVVAVNFIFHVTIEVVTPPFVIFYIHISVLFTRV